MTTRQLFYLLFAVLFVHAASSANIPFAQEKGCPAIVVEGTTGPVCPGKTLTFTAKVEGLASGAKPTFEWALSVGKIESGQGTDTVTVETGEIAGQNVKATVRVTGINAGCANTASQETPVAICCFFRLFDQYGNIAFNDEKARLDNFAIQLQNEPGSQGYIIAYGGRITFAWEARDRADRAKAYLTGKYNFIGDRIVTMDGGYREDLTVELWVIPADASLPTASPTLRVEDVRIVDKPVKDKPGRRPKSR